MKQNISTYPNYISGQHLTDTNLNNSFSFLDEQERLTRANFIGVGILDGLNYFWKKNSNDGTYTLTIGQGRAITANGCYAQVIQTHNNQSYSYWRKASKEEADAKVAYVLYQNNLEEDKDRVLIKNFDYNKYVIGLKVDRAQEKRAVCNQRTCNIINLNSEIICYPVLIGIEDAQKLKLSYRKLDPVPLTPFPRIVENMSFLENKINEFFKSNMSLLARALEEILMVSNDGRIISSYLWNQMSDESMHTFISIESVKIIKTYHLLFCEDLASAINEYIEFYNMFILNYASLIREDIVLIGIGDSMLDTDPYRDVFRPSHLHKKFFEDKIIVNKLFKRIDAMIRAFGYVEDGDIKLIPSKGTEAKLGERAIPSYYQYDTTNSTFSDLWQAHRLTPLPIYEYKTFQLDYLLDSHGCSFFRLEGHYEKDIYTIYNKINELIEKYNLPIEVCKMELMPLSEILDAQVGVIKTFDSSIFEQFANDKDVTIVEYGESINYEGLKESCLYLLTFPSKYKNGTDGMEYNFEYIKAFHQNLKSIFPRIKEFTQLLKKKESTYYSLFAAGCEKLDLGLNVLGKLSDLCAGTACTHGVGKNTTLALLYTKEIISYKKDGKNINGYAAVYFIDACIPNNIVKDGGALKYYKIEEHPSEEKAAAEKAVAEKKAAEEKAAAEKKAAEEKAAAEKKAAEGAISATSSYTITLQSCGAQKIEVIKAIREVTNLGLKESKDIADKVPQVVKKGVSKSEADAIKKKLVAAGATVEINLVDMQPSATSPYTITLTSCGPKKIEVIKVIKEITNLGLKESKDIADKVPQVVKNGASKFEADVIKEQLEAAGATVEIN